jgi:hypothetical protein
MKICNFTNFSDNYLLKRIIDIFFIQVPTQTFSFFFVVWEYKSETKLLTLFNTETLNYMFQWHEIILHWTTITKIKDFSYRSKLIQTELGPTVLWYMTALFINLHTVHKTKECAHYTISRNVMLTSISTTWTHRKWCCLQFFCCCVYSFVTDRCSLQ